MVVLSAVWLFLHGRRLCICTLLCCAVESKILCEHKIIIAFFEDIDLFCVHCTSTISISFGWCLVRCGRSVASDALEECWAFSSISIAITISHLSPTRPSSSQSSYLSFSALPHVFLCLATRFFSALPHLEF